MRHRADGLNLAAAWNRLARQTRDGIRKGILCNTNRAATLRAMFYENKGTLLRAQALRYCRAMGWIAA